jgi:hypothetical protein
MPDAFPSAITSFPESAPQRLRARVEALVEATAGAGDSQTPDMLLRAARQAIEGVLDAGAGDRDAALDVLSADALVTHALDLLALHPEDFEARCDQIVRQLAAIAPSS